MISVIIPTTETPRKNAGHLFVFTEAHRARRADAAPLASLDLLSWQAKLGAFLASGAASARRG